MDASHNPVQERDPITPSFEEKVRLQLLSFRLVQMKTHAQCGDED